MNKISFCNNILANTLAARQTVAMQPSFPQASAPDTFVKSSAGKTKEFIDKYGTLTVLGALAVSVPLSAVFITKSNKKLLEKFAKQTESVINATKPKNAVAPIVIAAAAAAGTVVVLDKKEPLLQAFHKAVKPVEVCDNREKVGEKINVMEPIKMFENDLVSHGDSIKALIPLTPEDKDGRATRAMTQVKRNGDRVEFEVYSSDKPLGKYEDLRYSNNSQDVSVRYDSDYSGEVSVMNTKGKLLAVLRDGGNVIMTNNGSVNAKDGPKLVVKAEQKNVPVGFEPFEPISVPGVDFVSGGPSIGKGAELIIGLEAGRFVKETIASIEEFQQKVRGGEIPLPQFRASEGTENLQISMLAGGFGSRAEYANASSSGIFDAKEGGRQSTKGVFRTPTGLTPMETTFISLHLAGLLDCSKENFGIGRNVKFYLNNSGINKGNGGFTIDMHDKTAAENINAEFIFPNDSISRMPMAIKDAASKINDGTAAIAMISKRVPAKEAEGTFGIMKLDEDNQILAFAEKPKPIPVGYADAEDCCLTNTFQFAVSKEAFEALKIVEADEGFKNALSGKETRDWSGHLIPVIMVLTRCNTPQEMRDILPGLTGKESNRFLDKVSDETLMRAKAALGAQKVYAVPTSEPWIDAGQLDAMYDVVVSIAKGEFPLLPFEQRNVINSINPKTGLIAATPQQLAEIEARYDVQGRVFAAPYADEAIPNEVYERNKNYITLS